ncbi:MAG: SurA N-terminal domain-containing protein, partial [Candidatus Omnitrophica bacterium]|nr:SurA N-terminal domain-containing protein [Candidatus Omnitrophota bacterium]
MKWVRKYAVWIAGAAIGGFLLWLVGTAVSLQGMQGQAAGTLFGKAVPVSHYMKALQAVLHQNILSRGDRAGQPPSQQLEQQAWERLILLTEARGKGIRVSDREVVE